MKAKIYGRRVQWYVDPIYPDCSLVYHNHQIYQARNRLTPTEVYYFVQGIMDKSTNPKTIADWSIEELEYVASEVPDIRIPIKSYIKNKRLNKEK